MPRDPNNCPECARSNGPHYTGPCDHGAPTVKAPTFTTRMAKNYATQVLANVDRFVWQRRRFVVL